MIFFVVQVYVDVKLFRATNDSLCKEFSEITCNVFEMSMMGILSWSTNKEKKNGIIICQSKYVRDLLKKYNMDQC